MKFGEIVVHMDKYNFPKFHQNQMKNKKVFLIAHFSVQNFKASVRIVKIVHSVGGAAALKKPLKQLFCLEKFVPKRIIGTRCFQLYSPAFRAHL